MRIAVEEIQEGVSTLETECSAKEIGLESEGISFVRPITAKLSFFKQIDKVYIKAELSAPIELECDRCLRPFKSTLEGVFENQYRPIPKTARDLLDDIGIRYYVGEYIELSEDFREFLLLELPRKMLCSQDCKGLCSRCGSDLNEGECSCRLESEEAPISKFAQLLKTLEVNKK